MGAGTFFLWNFLFWSGCRIYGRKKIIVAHVKLYPHVREQKQPLFDEALADSLGRYLFLLLVFLFGACLEYLKRTRLFTRQSIYIRVNKLTREMHSSFEKNHRPLDKPFSFYLVFLFGAGVEYIVEKD